VKKRIFLICPVRGVPADVEAQRDAYAAKREAEGHSVYNPAHDTDQTDKIGLQICTSNRWGIRQADEVHVWYYKGSVGSVFDFGIVFQLEKKLIIANPDDLQPTEGKSFENVLLAYSAKWM
jgi:hypothetical protein